MSGRKSPIRRPPTDATEGAEKVDYVDTSAYESYEKQEGDFVEPRRNFSPNRSRTRTRAAKPIIP